MYCWWNCVCTGPHRGVPNHLADFNNRAASIDAHQVPTLQEAVDGYQAAGGTLSPAAIFGSDPLANSPELLLQRQQALEENLPSPDELFSYTVNEFYQPFADSLQQMIQQTTQLSVR